ncbi:rhophilin-2-like isoform X2 [Lethenteron reissneri]|uniref:rhophilin-2-like isoform X2 n=1 Tax=Lethenteron reissneri TaxID=7753 RepID=UPI002AB72F46|nr:rhophilin-2-like isoform X2 [Lethenteron reissneri]
MIETQASDCVNEKMEEEVAGEEDEEDEEGVGLRKGCDPFYMTRRGKLQTERRKLNDQIIREARLREGAQNLYRATNNTKVRESVFLELSFVNSNLQLLWELLAQVNGSVDVYQPESTTVAIPMIPLGLKETEEIDFTTEIQEFICEHYGEDGSKYLPEIKEFMALRQAARTPTRDEAGLGLLMEYCSQLAAAEARFFPPYRRTKIRFTWCDSLSGLPCEDREAGFERASVLLNVGALYTQIAARCDRTALAGIDSAIAAFQRAAGVLSYLAEALPHPQTADLSPACLALLVRVCASQAQECVFERLCHAGLHNNFHSLLTAAQEAAKVAEDYTGVVGAMQQPELAEVLPFCWKSLLRAKSEHFGAVAHYYLALALLDHAPAPGEDSRDQEKALMDVHETLPEGPSMHVVVTNLDERTKLALGHLSKAVWRHEDAVRTASSLGRLGDLQNFLATARDQAKTRLAKFETDGGFINSSEAPEIAPETHHNPELKPPVFDKVEGTDIFRRLGPLSVFSAKQCLSKPRKVHLSKPAEGYGMRLGGDSPVRVVLVQPGSAAMEQRRIDSSPRPLATGTITGASTLTSGERVRGRKTLRDKVSSLFGRKKSRPKSVPGTLSSMFDSTKDWRGY